MPIKAKIAFFTTIIVGLNLGGSCLSNPNVSPSREKYSLDYTFKQEAALNPQIASQITSITQDNYQNFYFAFSNNGIWEKKNLDGKYYQINLHLSNNVVSKVKYIDNKVFFTIGNYLGYLDNNVPHIIDLSAKSTAKINDIVIYHKQMVLVTESPNSPLGYCDLDKINNIDSWDFYNAPDHNLGGNGGLCALYDVHNDALYVGSNGKGLFINNAGVLDGEFKHCTIPDMPDFDTTTVQNIIFAKNGDLYCSTATNYLGYFNNNNSQDPGIWAKYQPLLPEINYISITYDLDNGLWMVSDTNDIYNINYKNHIFEIKADINNYSLNFIMSMPSGIIFIAAQKTIDAKTNAYVFANLAHFRNNFVGIILISVLVPFFAIIMISIVVYLYLKKYNKLKIFQKKKFDKY